MARSVSGKIKSDTKIGNPWHEPGSGKFADAPPGVALIGNTLDILKTLEPQDKRAIDERMKKVSGDVLEVRSLPDGSVNVGVAGDGGAIGWNMKPGQGNAGVSMEKTTDPSSYPANSRPRLAHGSQYTDSRVDVPEMNGEVTAELKSIFEEDDAITDRSDAYDAWRNMDGDNALTPEEYDIEYEKRLGDIINGKTDLDKRDVPVGQDVSAELENLIEELPNFGSEQTVIDDAIARKKALDEALNKLGAGETLDMPIVDDTESDDTKEEVASPEMNDEAPIDGEVVLPETSNTDWADEPIDPDNVDKLDEQDIKDYAAEQGTELTDDQVQLVTDELISDVPEGVETFGDWLDQIIKRVVT